MTKFISFDIEIAAIIPNDIQDWKQLRPLGITCAAMAWSLSDETIITDTWHGENEQTRFAPRLSQDECIIVVHALKQAVAEGRTLLTHNGVSFDLDILAEESGLHAECVELAMNSVDTMLHFFCEKGFPVGLDAIAKGMGIPGKMEGMSGALVPQLWVEGHFDEVLDYVAQDAKCTLEVALAIEKRRELRWITQRGRLNMIPVNRLLAAREALGLPLPNTDWMMGNDRLTREKFTGWMATS